MGFLSFLGFLGCTAALLPPIKDTKGERYPRTASPPATSLSPFIHLDGDKEDDNEVNFCNIKNGEAKSGLSLVETTFRAGSNEQFISLQILLS